METSNYFNNENLISIISILSGVFLFLFAYRINKIQERKKYKSAVIIELRSLIEFVSMLGLKKIHKEVVTNERIDIKKEKTKAFFEKFYNEPLLLKQFISRALRLSGASLKQIHLLLSETECQLRENDTYSEFGLFGLFYLLYFSSDNKNEEPEAKQILKEQFLNVNNKLYGSFLKQLD